MHSHLHTLITTKTTIKSSLAHSLCYFIYFHPFPISESEWVYVAVSAIIATPWLTDKPVANSITTDQGIFPPPVSIILPTHHRVHSNLRLSCRATIWTRWWQCLKQNIFIKAKYIKVNPSKTFSVLLFYALTDPSEQVTTCLKLGLYLQQVTGSLWVITMSAWSTGL